jgi:OOP family OmpA-OmpF porin
MSLGDFSVMIEAGPRALIVAVVRGKPPENLRNTFKVALENIHQRASSRLFEYSGDPDDYLDFEPMLRSCLRLLRRDQTEDIDVSESIPWLALLSMAVLGSVVGWFWFQSYSLSNAHQRALPQLANEPGIVVVDGRVVDNLFLISGLRDQLAEEPEQVVLGTGGEAPPLAFAFKPYLSMEPLIIDRRARKRLRPPESASLSVQGGVLVVTGAANVDWIDTLTQNWQSVAGLDALNIDGLDGLDPVLAEIASLARLIESTTFYFDRAATEPNNSMADLPALARAIKCLIALGDARGINVSVRILGATDDTGSSRLYAEIAKQRAEKLYIALLALDIPAKLLVF